MKLSICSDSTSSSSEEDVHPILSEASSAELSPIEEDVLENETNSSCSNSSSRYMSSFVSNSLSNVSNLTADDQPDFHRERSRIYSSETLEDFEPTNCDRAQRSSSSDNSSRERLIVSNLSRSVDHNNDHANHQSEVVVSAIN